LFDGRSAGDWKVVQAGNAPSPPHVLAQLMGKGAEHAYKVVLIKGSISSDLELEVSLLPVAGKADMGGGLIWHAADDRNYYLTRANPLEQNIRIYRVVKGVRQMLLNFDQIIDVRSWHTLRVITTGCRIQVLFDEKQVFELCDEIAFSSNKVQTSNTSNNNSVTVASALRWMYTRTCSTGTIGITSISSMTHKSGPRNQKENPPNPQPRRNLTMGR